MRIAQVIALGGKTVVFVGVSVVVRQRSRVFYVRFFNEAVVAIVLVDDERRKALRASLVGYISFIFTLSGGPARSALSHAAKVITNSRQIHKTLILASDTIRTRKV
ncbi:MAG: hypothetical protein HC859_10990 [Bacteroidia bacterium]|nr:hypothetical protein [Bacteroidia bacterium]